MIAIHRTVRLAAALIATLTAAASAQPAGDPPEKPRLAIRAVSPSAPVAEAARADGQTRALAHVVAAADARLIQALADTRRFDIVARADLDAVLAEQDLAESGLLDPGDPQTARAYRQAGARYVAAVTIDNFQDLTATAQFTGGLGATTMERRTIQADATIRIYDTTTAALLDAATVRVEESAVRETLPGAEHTGRLTNELLGRAAEALATQAANAVMDRLTPARVLAYTGGQISLNRGAGAGIEVGQIWRVFFPGQPLIDPDTGERLGTEEVPVGWARVTEVNPRFSKAQAIEDTGIVSGAIMRHAPAGLPPGVDPDARATGSDRPRTADRPGDAARDRNQNQYQPGNQDRVPNPVTDRADPADLPAARRVAIFVRDAAAAVPDDQTDALEALVTASVAGPGIEIISRAVTLNAAADLAADGPNRGSDDPAARAAADLLSDQASARALARALDADAMLVVTAADLSESRRTFRDDELGVSTDLTDTTLTLAWSLVGADTGGAVASGVADATVRTRRSDRLTASPPDLSELMRRAADRIGPAVRAALVEPGLRRARPAGDAVAVRIDLRLEELSVPDIRRVDGEWVVTGERLWLEPAAAEIIVDGFLVGAAPGTVTLDPGPQRLLVRSPIIEPVDRFIAARDGLELTLPVRLSDDARSRWAENAAFLEQLRDGAALRERELELARGLAAFLSESRINLDTSSVQTIDLDPESVSFWADLIAR